MSLIGFICVISGTANWGSWKSCPGFGRKSPDIVSALLSTDKPRTQVQTGCLLTILALTTCQQHNCIAL